MKKAFLAVLLAFLILASGCTKTENKETKPMETPAPSPPTLPTTTPTPESGLIGITIDVPQSTETGTPFSGTYRVTSGEGTLEGLVLFVCHSKKGTTYSDYPLGDGFPCIPHIGLESGKSYSLNAFKLNETAAQSGLTEFFHEPGTYTYSGYLYKCSTIDEKFESAFCGWDVGNDTIISTLNPLKTESKSTTVTGQTIEPECNTNNNCIEPCDGCGEGPVCLYPAQKCVDCTVYAGCAKGYECIDHKCVPEKE